MMLPNRPFPPQRRKRDLASRVCAAIIGGYAAAAAVSLLLARLLPLSKASATTAALLSIALLYLAAILYAFGARSPSRAWATLGAITLAAGALSWALIARGGHS